MFSRRKFFGNAGALLTGGLFGFPGKSAARSPQEEQTVKTADVLLQGVEAREYDLIVVGGGISGVSAAISAARCGIRVALVHNRAMFGGNSSSEVKLFPENNSGAQPWIKEGGLNEEFHTEERVRNHEYYMEGTMNAHWDLVLYEWVIREKNITHYLNTHLHKAFMKDKRTIGSVFVVQLGTEKSFSLSAPLFVDATGDGVLGALAQAEHRWGREAKSEYGESLAPAEADETVMGNTLFFRARDTGHPVPFRRPAWAAQYPDEQAFATRGHSYIEGGYWWIEVGTPYHPIRDNNETRHEALRQLLGVWDHVKNQSCTAVDQEKAARYALDFVGFWPYKRASRRILGDYVLTQKDVQDPPSLPDAIAYGAWHIDVHVSGGILARDKESYPSPGRPVNWQDLCTMTYPIPIRSLYSRSVDNLMMAGRPISCSYLAFASSRVLSTGSLCGQAVGVVAALARKYHTLPREIARRHAEEAQQIVLRHDGHIPGVVNTDPADLARQASVTADHEAVLRFPDPNGSWELQRPYAQLFPVSGDRIDSVSLLLSSALPQPATLRVGLRKAASVGDFRDQEDIAEARAQVPAGRQGWVRFDMGATVSPDHLYYIYTEAHPGISWLSFKEEDGQPNRVPVGTTPATLPAKTSYAEKSTAYRSLFADTALSDIPGAGREGHWQPLTMGRSLCLRVTPVPAPYSPDNVRRGTNRPDQWTNIWISDPAKGLPVSLTLAWERPQRFNTVQLTFDTDQNRRVTLPLFRYPDCVKDYRLEAQVQGHWQLLEEVKDNYVRRRVHRLDRVSAAKLRITVMATNGAPSARLYEVRVYDE